MRQRLIVTETGRIRANIDSKGLKRTGSAIILKVRKISAFGAKELHGVKPLVMYGISGIFPENIHSLPIAHSGPHARRLSRERMALAKALRNETNNSKFAKRTWNVTWNQ